MNIALLYAVLAAIFGGSVPVLSKYGLEVFPVFAMNSLRFLSATLVFLPFMLPRIRRILHKNVIITSLIALLNPVLFIIAINLTKASVAPLIYASVPLMVAMYGRFRGERLTVKKWIGVFIGFSGVSLTVLLPLFTSANSQNPGSFMGNVLIFFAAIVFFAYTQLSKDLQDKGIASPLEITFAFTATTFLLTLPLGLWDIQKIDFSQVTPLHITAALVTGMVGTSLFYLVYQKALKEGSALSASTFVFLQPLATASLAFFVLGEHITIPLVIGGLLAIVGAKLAS